MGLGRPLHHASGNACARKKHICMMHTLHSHEYMPVKSPSDSDEAEFWNRL
jgi:hypothetical protein